MSISDAKRALQECEKGIQLLTAQQRSNQVLVDDYNKRSQEVNEKRNIYNTNKSNYEGKLFRWTNKKDEYSKYQKYDGVNREFWANETDGTCWWGENWGAANEWCNNKAYQKGYDGENYWAKSWRSCNARRGDFLCKKDDNIANQQVTQYNNDKPQFNEQLPPDAAPIQQNTTPVNISCCANTMNIIGSSVDSSTIRQQNDCAGQKRRDIENAEANQIAATNAAATNAATADAANAANAAAATNAANADAANAAAATNAANAVNVTNAANAAAATNVSKTFIKGIDNKYIIMIILAIISLSLSLSISSIAVVTIV